MKRTALKKKTQIELNLRTFRQQNMVHTGLDQFELVVNSFKLHKQCVHNISAFLTTVLTGFCPILDDFGWLSRVQDGLFLFRLVRIGLKQFGPAGA